MYVYIYIYTERERQLYVYIYIYIYTYMYVCAYMLIYVCDPRPCMPARRRGVDAEMRIALLTCPKDQIRL